MESINVHVDHIYIYIKAFIRERWFEILLEILANYSVIYLMMDLYCVYEILNIHSSSHLCFGIQTHELYGKSCKQMHIAKF